METLCTLSDIKDILNEERYFCLGHGTGRSGDKEEIVKSIFKTGLRTKDNSLFYTSIGLDTGDIEKLETKLNNWEHCESKKIILIRIPIKYINALGDTSDLDGERYGAFMLKREESGKMVNYVDPKFIIGCYDANNHEFESNDKFEKSLSKESIETLEKQYGEALEKTKTRLERLSMITKLGSNVNQKENVPEITYDKTLPENFDFDDETEWDMPSEGQKL